MRSSSGGLWSDNANWQDGIVGNGAGNTADFNTLELVDDNVVRLDSPRTIGNLVFGDTDPASAGSWILDDDGDPANVLTLAAPVRHADRHRQRARRGATATLAARLGGHGRSHQDRAGHARPRPAEHADRAR